MRTLYTHVAHQGFIFRITAERTTGNHGYRRQETGEGSYRSGFSSATLSPDENTANVGIDQAQDQGLLHLLLTDDGSEWEYWSGKLWAGPVEMIVKQLLLKPI